MKIRKLLLLVAPYLVSIVIGLALYFISLQFSENIKNLFINISAAFLAIPLIFLFYQVIQNFSKRRLNKEIFDYAKMQVDREVLSIINHLNKIVYSLGEKDFSIKGINDFLDVKNDELKKILAKNEYLGFQVYKNWEASEESLHDILKNSYILARLEDAQTISIILLIKKLRYLVSIQNIKDLYLETGKKVNSYTIVPGQGINAANKEYSNRYILLQELGEDKSRVADFGDFSIYNIDKLLFNFTINAEHIERYADSILQLTAEVKNWLDLSGKEFIIDNKMFRPGIKTRNGNLS